MFSFEESALINEFFEGASEELTREAAIQRLIDAAANTEEKELVAIAESTVSKLKYIDDDDFKTLIRYLPLATM